MVLFMCLTVLGIFGGVIIAIQFPYVQTKLVQKASVYISRLLNYPITINSVDISWFDMIDLNGVKVMDKEKNQMIFLEEATVDFSIRSFSNPELVVDEIVLRNGSVNLYKFRTDSTINITDFIASIRALARPKEEKSRTPVPFTVEKVRLENMYFSYFDQSKPLIKEGFDHNHFIFENINARVADLKIVADTFQIDVLKLDSKEKQTGLSVQNTSVLFTVTKSNMLFENIDANIGNSKLNHYLRFEYANINDLSDFNDKINVYASLDSSIIYSGDLGNFAPQVAPYHDYALLSGQFEGKVTNFVAKNLNFGFGKNSLIKGRAHFKGLPELSETYIDFKFKNSSLSSRDLKQYAGPSSYSVLSKFGNLSGTGEFVGFSHDFVAQGKFNTDIGYIESDLNFKILENEAPSSTYRGTLVTKDFNLGKFLDLSDKVGKIDMNGSLEGEGLNLAEAKVNLKANISKINVNRYTYRGIETNAILSDELFDGKISVNDPNLKFSANGLINLKENINKFDISASFEKANLKPLNISRKETYLISDFKLNFTGLTMDEFEGEAYCANTYLLFEGNKELFIDTLYTSSHKKDSIRNFYLNSDLLGVNASGNFEFASLIKDITRLYKEYRLNIENNQSEIESYYANIRKGPNETSKYGLNFDIHIKDLNHLFSVYLPGLYLSENTQISGEFSKGHTTIFNCTTYIDSLYYKEHEVYNTVLELNSSKLRDSSNVLAMAYIKSPKQAIKDLPETENFVFEGIWDNNKIQFSSSIEQSESSNKINLNGNLSLQEDNKKIVSLRNSSFSLLDKTWNIGQLNEILLSKEGAFFRNFTINNYEQTIGIEGNLSPNTSQDAYLTISNFQLATINSLIEGSDVEGTVNGKFILKDIIDDLNLNGNLKVDTFKVDNFLIGNIEGEAGWNNNYKKLDVKVDVIRNDEKIIYVNGDIKQNHSEQTQDLNLTARLTKANLEVLNPVLEGAISNVTGTATGKLFIGGTPQNLVVKGEANINNASFRIDYLNTTYFLDDYVYMDENLIGFKKLKLRDSYGDIAVVDGGIYHDNFRDFVLNIKGYMNNFHMLNTTEKDNELFYGTAFVSGDMELLGAFNDFEIKANAVSNKGTKIYIPIQESSSIEQQSFIKFTSSKPLTDLSDEDEEGKVDLSGIKMDFNFEITPDAYAEIIFDKRAGDIIRGNGSGNLIMQIDTRGDFFLYGSYYMQKGGYNFTMANLINKEFTIKPNSSITWYGDPYKGVLDIDAVYHQSASLKPLITNAEDSVKAETEGSRKTPVNVQMGLTGDLLSPDINLGIKILNYPVSVEQYVTGFESMIAQNEQELNRQVFSLLILGGFAPQYSFSGLAPDPTSNLSELLTNQLGNWLSQVDENLQIDLDLNGLDREALNTFNLRLSYTLLDGRLRITRDGRFTNVDNEQPTDPTNPDQSNSNSSLSNLAGEWTIEYLIAPDGKLRLKLFNKNTQNQVGGITNTSAGFSLLHTASFNSIEDLFTKKKKAEIPFADNKAPSDTSNSQNKSLVVPVKLKEND